MLFCHRPTLPARIAGLSLLALLALAPLAALAAEPSRNIQTYVLFALTDLDFKGRNADPTRGFITGGNVGVNALDNFDPNSPLMGLGVNGAVVMSEGTQVVTDSGRINSNATVYDLFINDHWGSSWPTIVHSGPNTFTAPIIAPQDLPPAPDCQPGITPVDVPENTIVAVGPGSYGDVTVHDGGTLNLSAGLYQLASFHCGKNVTIHTQPGTILTIASDFSLNNGSYFGPSCDVQVRLCSIGVGSNDATVSFGKNSIVYGCFWAPYGQINLGHSTDLFGKFWADRIGSDWNVNMELCGNPPVPVTPTTWSAIKNRFR